MLWHIQVELACAQNTFSFHFPSLSQHKSPISGLHKSSLLAGRTIIPNSAHLCSLHLSTTLLLFCGLALQCFLLLHLRCTCQVASPRPYQLYFCFPCFSVAPSPGSESWHISSTPRLMAVPHCLLLKPRAHYKLLSSQPGLLLSLTTFLEYILKTPGICTQTQSQGKQRTNKHQDSAGCKVPR